LALFNTHHGAFLGPRWRHRGLEKSGWLKVCLDEPTHFRC
jgi:hypothetical protein